MKNLIPPAAAAFAAILGLVVADGSVAAAQECKNRGQLDTLYCDDNNDLVADAPTDPKKWKDPATLVFAYTPVEDPAVYQNMFKPFTDYLGQCTGKRVVYYPVQSNSAEIEAMRSGRLHVAGFSTGPTGFRGQSRGRRAVRRQGHREGPARLSSDFDRARRQPVPEALRSQGQARRAHRRRRRIPAILPRSCSIRRRA